MGDRELIRIGIIGTGTYGRTHLNALSQRQRLSGDVELVGFAEINPQTRRSIEKEYGIAGYRTHMELIEKAKPEAVCVVTPDHLHYDVVMDCLGARLPMLVEKPFATDLQQAKEMARKTREQDLFLQVDFHKRFDPYHIDLKMRIEEGELGKIQYGYCWMEDVLEVGTSMIGKKTWEDQGSPAWFLGIHMIDLTYWAMGMPKPEKVYASGFKGKLSSMGIDIYDSVKASVTYENGAVITYDSSVILPNSHEASVRQGVKFVGTEGFMEVNSQYRGARGCSTAIGMDTPNLGGKHRTYAKRGGTITRGYLNDSIYDFIENLTLLRGGMTVEELEGRYASPEQGIESTKIGVAIHESARSGQVIDITKW
jgi:predicted dehydrogenase